MPLIHRRPARAILAVAAALSLCVFAAGARAADALPGDTISFAADWARSVDYVSRGQFERADEVLQNLAAESAAPDKAKVWLNEWLAEEKSRQELTRSDYESYAARAKKWFGKDNIQRALQWTYTAMLSAEDEETFRRLAWVHQIRDTALAEGERLYGEHEWRDAHEIFYSLSLIFEDDKPIDKRRQECLEHARLEEIYKPDREWTERLEGITEGMVEEALYRIDQKYVVEADFRAMTIAGYEELLLISESPILREQFEGLTGERGEEFASRLRQRMRQIEEQPALTSREARHYFRRAMKINNQTSQIPAEMFVLEYMNAALEELDDFSSMIWPYDYREFAKHTRGDFVGVGIQIRNKYNTDLEDIEIVVVTPLEDTPAYRAGIQAEDIITKVNDTSLVGVSVTKAVTMITGPLNTNVTLTVRRKLDSGEEKEIPFTLQRAVVSIVSVKSLERRTDDEQLWDFLLDDDAGIAYVRVGSFQENTVSQLRLALEEAQQQGMRGLILDLRFNPGGLLKSAVEMSELFLAKGSRIVSTKGLRSPEWSTDTHRAGDFGDIPLIVLVNESSASASEIVAGAIHDHGRGLVIGERSFGKGSVQNLIQLTGQGDAHLKLTTARYYLPSGRSLHREDGAKDWGVEPDIAVPLVPKEHRKVVFMRRDADVIGAVKTKSEDELDEPLPPADDDKDELGEGDDNAKAQADEDGKDKEEEEEEEPDPDNFPSRDPQLETAVLVMRLHLLNEEAGRMAHSAPAKQAVPVANE